MPSGHYTPQNRDGRIVDYAETPGAAPSPKLPPLLVSCWPMIDPADDLTRPLPVASPCPIRMQFAAPDRLHTVVLMQDLLEQWVLLQGWAGRAQASGRSGGRSRPLASLEDGIAALQAIAQRHQKQGCTLVAA
jgi:hypothetical protein